MSELTLSIDGSPVTVDEGSSILDACRTAASAVRSAIALGLPGVVK